MIYFAPEQTELLKRIMCVGAGTHQLVLGFVRGFSLMASAPDQPLILQTENFWDLVSRHAEQSATIDEGWPKAHAEFLAYGSCYKTSAAATQPVAVRIVVGELSKQLAVFGDRQFTAGGSISQPHPFTRMHISPHTAFGGPGYEQNPAGKGMLALKHSETNSPYTPLPNIEHPSSLLMKPTDRPIPAGFWALASDTPSRKVHLGKFDEAWKLKRWPHLPIDTHPDYFQTAPEDQRVSGYFSGKELIQIHNMHPKHALLESKLPDLRARVLIKHTRGSQGDVIREHLANIDTVWLFPEALTGFFVSRCVIPTTDADAQDLTHAFVEFESASLPAQPFEALEQRFRTQLLERANQNDVAGEPDVPDAPPSATIAFENSKRPSASIPLEGIESLEPSKQQIAQQLNHTASAQGVSMATLPPEIAALLKPEDLKPVSELQSLLEFKSEIDKSNTQIRAMLKEAQIDNPNFINALKANPETAEQAIFLQSAPSTIESMMSELEQNLAEMIALEKQSPIAAEAIKETLIPAATGGALLASNAKASTGIQYNREWVIEQHRLQHSFKGFDLSGLDLSGLDLNQANFQEATLIATNFSNTALANAVFEDAVLDSAKFDGANLNQANLRGVSAQHTSFTQATLESASLREADFTRSDFTSAKLTHANLKESILSGARLSDTQAQKITADGIQLDQADCSRADFSQARMPDSNFYGCILDNTNFSGANCKESDFSGACGRVTKFSAADLSDSQADFQARFDGALFDHCNMKDVNWNKVSLVGAHFDQANLSGSDLTGANLKQSCLVDAVAKNLCLDRCDLSEADLSGINLFEGSLRNSRLKQAKMVSANLYGVDFLEASLEGADLDGSIITKTILEFRHP